MKKLFALLLCYCSFAFASGVSSISNYNPSAVAITGGTFTGITQGTISTGTGAGDAHFNINKTDAGSAAEIYFKDNNVAKWNLGAFNVGACGAGNFAVYNYTMAALNVCIDSATGSVVMAGGINSTPVGATTPSNGKFTTLQANTGLLIAPDIQFNGAGSTFANYQILRHTNNLLYIQGGSGIQLNRDSSRLDTVDIASTINQIDIITNGVTRQRTTNAGTNFITGILNNGTLLISPTAPTIANGFGTGASIVHSNGTASFQINVGTGGTATQGNITIPAAPNGWSCQVYNDAGNTADMRDSARSISTTDLFIIRATVSTNAATAWPSGTLLDVMCLPF